MRTLAMLAMLSACGGAPSAPPAKTAPLSPGRGCEGVDERPGGTIADYHAPEIDGFTISAPALCPSDHDSAYIRIERTHGARELGTGQRADGAFATGCLKPPADPADATQCPVLNWGVPIIAAQTEMARRHIEINGLGAGPCADTSGDYTAWRMSLGVTSWTVAEQLVREVAAEMDRYDTRGFVGVAVRGIRCAVLL